jgi:hypothetical protein
MLALSNRRSNSDVLCLISYNTIQCHAMVCRAVLLNSHMKHSSPRADKTVSQTHRQERISRRASHNHRVNARRDKIQAGEPVSRQERMMNDRRENMMHYLLRVREKRMGGLKKRPNLGEYLALVQEQGDVVRHRNQTEDERNANALQSSDTDDDGNGDEDVYAGMVIQVPFCPTCRLEKEWRHDSCWNAACVMSPVYDPWSKIHILRTTDEEIQTRGPLAVPQSPRAAGFINVLASVADAHEDEGEAAIVEASQLGRFACLWYESMYLCMYIRLCTLSYVTQCQRYLYYDTMQYRRSHQQRNIQGQVFK